MVPPALHRNTVRAGSTTGGPGQPWVANCCRSHRNITSSTGIVVSSIPYGAELRTILNYYQSSGSTTVLLTRSDDSCTASVEQPASACAEWRLRLTVTFHKCSYRTVTQTAGAALPYQEKSKVTMCTTAGLLLLMLVGRYILYNSTIHYGPYLQLSWCHEQLPALALHAIACHMHTAPGRLHQSASAASH
jgi:hypothetical protein